MVFSEVLDESIGTVLLLLLRPCVLGESITEGQLDLTRSATATRPSTNILAMSSVITFELLPVITLLVESSTTVNTAAKIAFREKESLVRV